MNTRNLVIAAVLCVGFSSPSMAAAAETGIIKNNTKIKITYQSGVYDAKGYITWQNHTLAPGQSHTWTVRDPKRMPLHIRWDLTLGDGKFVPTQWRLATRPNGFRSAFHLNGNQVFVDASGAAK